MQIKSNWVTKQQDILIFLISERADIFAIPLQSG